MLVVRTKPPDVSRQAPGQQIWLRRLVTPQELVRPIEYILCTCQRLHMYIANTNLQPPTHPLQNPHHILRKHPHNLLRQRQRNNHNRQKHTPHRHKKHHISHSQNSDRPILRLLHHFRQTKQESTQPEDPFEESGEHDAADDGDVDDVFDGPWWGGRRSVEEGGGHWG